jgi:hypothetical protein
MCLRVKLVWILVVAVERVGTCSYYEHSKIVAI